MVLGRARPRFRSDGSRLFALRHDLITSTPQHTWPATRGDVLFEAQADVTGGFPGYADHGCALSGVQLRVTEHFLLVDEGQPHGFGLPLTAIDGTVLVELPGRDDYALRVFYRLAGQARLCTVTFRSGRVGTRGGRRSVRAQETLHQAGLRDRYADNPPLEPEFTLPWDRTREFEHENVIWTGRANAPVRIGSEPAPSEIWLTTNSLIWGSGDGVGINRVPLLLLMDVVSTRLRDRFGTPVIYLAIGDESTGRYELPFIFSLHTPPDRNFRERGAFLVGLRSRGLEDGSVGSYSRPWRDGLLTVDRPLATTEVASYMPDDDSSNVESALAITNQALNDVELNMERPDNISDFTLLLERRRLASTAPSDASARSLDSNLEVRLATDQALPEVIQEDLVPNVHVDAELDILQDLAEQPAGEPQRDDPTEPLSVTTSASSAPSFETSEATDLVLAEWAASGDEFKDDFAISQSWAPERPSAKDDHPLELDTNIDASERTTSEECGADHSEDSRPFPAVRTYEEAAVGALTEVLRVIDARVAGNKVSPLAERSPSLWDQARALTELAQSTQRGEISAAEARDRTERLIALGEVCVRLRTLVELHANGILATAQLDAKRIDLMNTRSVALAKLRPVDSKSEVA